VPILEVVMSNSFRGNTHTHTHGFLCQRLICPMKMGFAKIMSFSEV